MVFYRFVAVFVFFLMIFMICDAQEQRKETTAYLNDLLSAFFISLIPQTAVFHFQMRRFNSTLGPN